MADGRDEFYFGGLEGVVFGDFDVEEPAAAFIGRPLHALHDCCPMEKIPFHGRKLLETFVRFFGVVFELAQKAFGDVDDAGGGHCVPKRVRLCMLLL